MVARYRTKDEHSGVKPCSDHEVKDNRCKCPTLLLLLLQSHVLCSAQVVCAAYRETHSDLATTSRHFSAMSMINRRNDTSGLISILADCEDHFRSSACTSSHRCIVRSSLVCSRRKPFRQEHVKSTRNYEALWSAGAAKHRQRSQVLSKVLTLLPACCFTRRATLYANT